MSALVVRARTVITCEHDVAQDGVSFEALGKIEEGAVVTTGGRIAWAGTASSLPAEFRDATVLDLPDCVVFPGFVDAHAHPFFAGDREPDFSARVRGEAPPLGMRYTIERTREALDRPQRFWVTVRARLRAMLAHGTTTLESKTGYALHAPGENALLGMIAAHKDDADIPALIATFLGAHALPPEFTDEARFVDYLIEQCLPTARAHGAVYADAFCEPGYFTPPQTRRYLEAARKHGLRVRLHCDEFGDGGAAALAAAMRSDSADHCNCITQDGISSIVSAGVVLVACPATIAYLQLERRAPVRQVLRAGGTVALASDYNPGTSPCFNMQTVAFFGRQLFGMTAPEALYASTVAAAKSLHSDAGRIVAGAPADLVALRIGSPHEFGWQFGGNLAAAVIHRGKAVA